jgi:hypothetical protein
MTPLDRHLTALAGAATGRDLSGLDREVWRVIDARPAMSTRRLRPIQWAAVSAALVVGAVTGTFAMTSFDRTSEMSVFSAHSPLAPSTLLADHA